MADQKPKPATVRAAIQAAETASAELIQELLDRLQISQWDLLLVSDGSGSKWNMPFGWAVVLVEAITLRREVFYGAASRGSINLAESMPILHAISWYDSQIGQTLLKSKVNIRVAVVTDSEVVRTWGNRTDGRPPKTLLPFWLMFNGLRSCGYVFKFHHIPRLTHDFNVYSDLIAGLSRLAVQNMSLEQAAAQRAIAQHAAMRLRNLDR